MMLFWEVFGGLKELAVFTFFGASDSRGEEFLSVLRAFHPQRPFECWALACDHFQFAAYCLLHTEFGHVLADLDMIAVLLLILAFYSDPVSAADIPPNRLAQFGLEVCGGLSLTATLFSACAQTRLLENSLELESRALWGLIRKVEDGVDAWADASATVILVALSRYSYMFRTTEIAVKWIERKFTGLPHGTEKEIAEVRRFEVSAEIEVAFMPLFEKALTIDPNLRALFKPVQETLGSLLKS
jgi:hypothetical protein